MKAFWKLMGVFLLAGAAVSPAKADLFSFNYIATTGGTYSASGVFTTGTANGSGFNIADISGTVTGAIGGGAIISLLPATTHSPGDFIADNVLFPSADPVHNDAGALFTMGADEWNIWGNGPGSYSMWHSTIGHNWDVQTTGTMTIAAIPEPDTYAMMLAGLGLMGFIARRRKQKETA
jgi:hypothetical protein